MSRSKLNTIILIEGKNTKTNCIRQCVLALELLVIFAYGTVMTEQNFAQVDVSIISINKECVQKCNL